MAHFPKKTKQVEPKTLEFKLILVPRRIEGTTFYAVDVGIGLDDGSTFHSVNTDIRKAFESAWGSFKGCPIGKKILSNAGWEY